MTMRIRDKVFTEEWEKTTLSETGAPILALAHHLFGALALGIIVFQSAFSLNIYVFTIWLILGIVILLIDFIRGTSLSLGNELSFGVIFILGTVISLIVGNVNSMFFPETLGRIDIILYQVFAGICVSIRFLITFFYVEFFSQRNYYVKPISTYTEDQVHQYKQNLIKTDFEYVDIKTQGLFQEWGEIFKRMLWPLIILTILTAAGIIYSLIIFYMIPNNAIAELVIRPSLIIIALFYTYLLIRTNSVLIKIHEKDKPVETEDVMLEDLEE